MDELQAWVVASDNSLSSKLISSRETNCVIHWIEIYPVDSVIHVLNKKNALYLSVNVFSMKALTGDTIFLRLLLEMGLPFYLVIRATRRSSHLQGKGSTFISQ